MWGLVRNNQWVITFYFQSFISPHSAVNTRYCREHHWITSSHQQKKWQMKGFLNMVAIQFPWKPTESTEINSRWDNEHHERLTKTKALSHRWHLLLSQYGSNQTQLELQERERPPWYSTAWSSSLRAPQPFFSPLIRITANHSEKRQSFQTWWQNHTTMWKEKATSRTQWEFTADWNNPHVVDWHSPKGEERKKENREREKNIK